MVGCSKPENAEILVFNKYKGVADLGYEGLNTALPDVMRYNRID